MPEIKAPLTVGDKTAETAEWVAALPENAYFVDRPILGSLGYITSMPAIELYAINLGQLTNEDRGGIFVERETFRGHYRVIGNSLVQVIHNPNGQSTTTTLGEITGSGRVSMDYSFNNLAIVADKKLYYYNPTEGLRQLTDPDIGEPLDIAWGDNYFILTDGENIYHSEILNEEEFGPLDFATAEFRPDPSLGVAFNEDSELIVFGSKSIEYFRNVAAQDFAFQRITQKAQKIGVTGVHAKGVFGNAYYMIGGRDNTSIGAYVTEGGVSNKISSYAVDKLLAEFSYGELFDAIVEAIEIDGIQLVYFHFPEYTLLFNRTLFNRIGAQGAWSYLFSVCSDNYSKRQAYDAVNFVRDPDAGLWLFGTKEFGIIGKYEFKWSGRFATPQEVTLYTPLLKLESLSINSIECETVGGFGVDPDSASETTAFISRTNDGVVWGKEWELTYGKRHKYDTRFIANRLGYCRDFTGFRVRINSKSRLCFAIDMKLDVS